MRTITTLFVSIFFVISVAQAEPGLVTLSSQFSVEVTADRFVTAAEDAGLKIFSRIDHAAGAAQAGLSLRPTRLILFGSPKVGTALMTSDQRAGIDLPMKALVWEDAEGKVWFGYNTPEVLFGRFGIDDRDAVKKKVTGALKQLSQYATQP
jgi:uncharacterized protein (DUF302 family)